VLPTAIFCTEWNQSKDIEDNRFMTLSRMDLLSWQQFFSGFNAIREKKVCAMEGLVANELQWT